MTSQKLLFIWLCLNWLIDYDRWYTRLLYVLTLFEDVGLDLPEYVAHLAAGHSSRGMGRLWTTRAVTNKLTTIGWQTVVPSLVGYWFAAKKLRWTDPPPPPLPPPCLRRGPITVLCYCKKKRDPFYFFKNPMNWRSEYFRNFLGLVENFELKSCACDCACAYQTNSIFRIFKKQTIYSYLNIILHCISLQNIVLGKIY